MNVETTLPDDLTDGERAILKRLAKKPLDLYWGRGGWCFDYLPKPAKRADFDKLTRRQQRLVKIECARLVLDTDEKTDQ